MLKKNVSQQSLIKGPENMASNFKVFFFNISLKKKYFKCFLKMY